MNTFFFVILLDDGGAAPVFYLQEARDEAEAVRLFSQTEHGNVPINGVFKETG